MKLEPHVRYNNMLVSKYDSNNVINLFNIKFISFIIVLASSNPLH